MHDIPKPQATRLSIREDQAAAAASRLYGARLDAVGFNMTFLSAHDPQLANEVLTLLRRAGDLEATVPDTPRSLALHRPA